jgi:hypothetical protein
MAWSWPLTSIQCQDQRTRGAIPPLCLHGTMKIRDSSVSIVTRLWAVWFFLFTTVSRMALGPTQPAIQWVAGTLSLGVKRPWHEADHSPPSSAKVKEHVELYLHYIFMAWCLIKHRDFNWSQWQAYSTKETFTYLTLISVICDLHFLRMVCIVLIWMYTVWGILENR